MQANQQLIFYKPGQQLRVYLPGEAIRFYHPSYSLMVFRVTQLAFKNCNKAIVTRVQNFMKNRNIIYIGDLVRQTEEQLMEYADKEHWLNKSRLGKKSMGALRESLADIGLCMGLRIDDWPPEKIETLESQLASYPKTRGRHCPETALEFYLKDVLRPA